MRFLQESTRTPARGAALLLCSSSLLFALFTLHNHADPSAGIAVPQGLSHAQTLWQLGHLPGAALVGLLLSLVAAIGAMTLLGDSPFQLQGNEVAPAIHQKKWQLPLLLGLLYLPCAGLFGLWDPWETHYGEVAREMLSRDDWITLWWGPEGWFMSKPVFLHAMLGLGLSAGSLFHNTFLPGLHLHGEEWWMRLPIALLSLATLYAVQSTITRVWSERAGFWSALVLATTPFWLLLSHQAMTDLPFVSLMTLAMMALLRALTTDTEETQAVVFSLRSVRVRWSLWHSFVLLAVVFLLPQVLYLLSRPMLFQCPEGAGTSCEQALAASRIGSLQFPIERFFAGSGINSIPEGSGTALPGTIAWEARYNAVPFAISFVQGLVWLLLGTGLLWIVRNERSERRLLFLFVYAFGGMSFLAKGPAGLGVPEIVLGLFLASTGQWHLLRRLDLRRGLLVFLLFGLPWYVAITMRLGQEFLGRFVVHDLLDRSFSGVHGDRGFVGYYIEQLSYGLFPWGALVPLALFYTVAGNKQQEESRTLLRSWFLVTFSLFSLMATHFHHYIFPAVPPAAILVGVLIAEYQEGTLSIHPTAWALPCSLTLLTAQQLGMHEKGPARYLHLFTYNYERALPPSLESQRAVLVCLGVGALLGAIFLLLPKLRMRAFPLLGLVALLQASWILFGYFPLLSRDRSQRGLFQTVQEVQGNERLALGAYALNWKGELFYSGGAIAQFDCGFGPCRSGAFRDWLQQHRNERVLVLTEQSRIGTVRSTASQLGRTLLVQYAMPDPHGSAESRVHASLAE